MPSAQRTIGQASSQWEIHPWHRCSSTTDSQTFPDRSTAAIWVRQFRSDAIIMADLRSVVAAHSRAGSQLWRKNDEQILDDLSWLLSEGVLHVHRVPGPATAWLSGAPQSSAPDVAPVSRPSPARSAAASPVERILEEADTFTSQLDAAAMAAVLTDASASGVPFCEECAKAAAASRKAA